MRDFVFDIEVFPNVFTLTIKQVGTGFSWYFEISPRRDDSREAVSFLHWMGANHCRMVGFNNIGFDYPICHMLMKMGTATAGDLYMKAMTLINSQDDDRFTHLVRPSDWYVDQIDLYKIHHFDNRARATGLKALEFSMRSDSIQDLPFPVGIELTNEQIEVLKEYNAHDVDQTLKFYKFTLPMIRFREELSVKYPDVNWLNFNDTKIGKEYFIMELEKAGVACYQFGPDGRTPKQTKRPVIHLKDAVLPWIQFREPEFNRILDYFKSQSITETKGTFKDLVATVGGMEFVFGTGGIHGSVKNQVIEADGDYMLVDLDVASYYPNLAICNKFYPEHLTPVFCEIYQHLFEERKKHAKGSAINAMLKLALNGVYGDSNNQFSVFYDPLFTMRITLNGQLLLCLLAERLIAIEGLSLIQVNTDGLTVKVHRGHQVHRLEHVRKEWEKQTGLTLEESQYSRMFIRDVNNYVAEYVDGKVKRKGAYEYVKEWHQDASALVIPKVAEQVLLHGVNIRQTVQNWPDPMDFMLRVKVPRKSYLSLESNGENVQQQNTCRYFISKSKDRLLKWMPPLKGKTEWRRFEVEAGWGVTVANNLKDLPPDYRSTINFDYYVQEVEKLVMRLA